MAKNQSDFVSLPWKLDITYFHSVQCIFIKNVDVERTEETEDQPSSSEDSEEESGYGKMVAIFGGNVITGKGRDSVKSGFPIAMTRRTEENRRTEREKSLNIRKVNLVTSLHIHTSYL